MKLSVSLSESDVAVLDDYARTAGLSSRSAAVQRAIRLLRQQDLEQDYADAWQEWRADGSEQAWEVAAADGLASRGEDTIEALDGGPDLASR